MLGTLLVPSQSVSVGWVNAVWSGSGKVKEQRYSPPSLSLGTQEKHAAKQFSLPSMAIHSMERFILKVHRDT